MPIQDAPGAAIVILGDGDVSISLGLQAGAAFEDEIVFTRCRLPCPLGARLQEIDDTTAGYEMPVRLVFKSTAALDILMDQLLRLRTAMSQGKT